MVTTSDHVYFVAVYDNPSVIVQCVYVMQLIQSCAFVDCLLSHLPFKELPEGAAFSAVYQETKDHLLACKLRVSQKSAADQIWNDYGSGKLMAVLKKSLLSGLGSEVASHLAMSIGIMKEEYESACDILAGKSNICPILAFSV